MRLLSLDLETGGRHPWSCGITEIGAVIGEVKDGRFDFEDELSHLVRPVEGLLYESTALHLQRRTYSKLEAYGIEECEALSELVDFIEDYTPDVITAFNLDFDWSFLDALAFRVRKAPFVSLIPLETERVCAASLSRNAFDAEKRGWSLRTAWETSCGFFAWDEDEAHSALYDAKRAAEVYAAALAKGAQDA